MRATIVSSGFSDGRRKVACLAGALCAVGLIVAFGPNEARAASPVRCDDASPSCTVAWAARRSGIWAGTAIDNAMPAQDLADATANFNAFTTENAFKWGVLEPSRANPNWAATDALVAFAENRGMRIRGHALFWHRMQNPAWLAPALSAASDRKALLRQLVKDHTTSVVSRYRGRVSVWDVVNEPLALFGGGWDRESNSVTPANFFYTALGEQYIDLAFRSARSADPKAKLFLNELVWNPAVTDAKAKALLRLVGRLKQRRVPIDGVGLQMHAMLGAKEPSFSGSAAKLTAYMRALTALGVKVEVTELDVSLPQVLAADGSTGTTRSQALALQADVYSRVVKPCAQVPGCTGVTVWGLRDSDTWLDSFGLTSGLAPHEPLLLDGAGQRKPAYRALRDALLARCAGRAASRNPCSSPWPSK